MASLVSCPHGHRWEIRVSGSKPPQNVCQVCGAAPESLVDVTTVSDTVVDSAATHKAMALPTHRPRSAKSDDTRAAPGGLLKPAMTGSLPTALPLAAPKRIGGYEVLEVLGQGGMGVVYKAYQPSLKRIVALKMIHGACAEPQSLVRSNLEDDWSTWATRAFTRPESLVRFSTEAEAVAQLQHANITQIHEIGTHQGRPFLSLEYVDGGTLASRLLRSLPMPREACQLTEALARAMHFAHQRGIIHRDLKPSNVLLTREGQPKVSDFGLAKWIHTGNGSRVHALTQSGEVLGTPSYMAPEQADGRLREMGPATDIYSLGVILYEMLTGKPPFTAETALEVLDCVLHEEPVPPRQLQSRVPRDLETICLACLEKRPQDRYPSAEALADDLRAFLAGDPIQARPATRLERFARWTRRRPTLAVLLAVSGIGVVGLLVGALQQIALPVGCLAMLSMLLASWWYNARLQTAVRDLAHEHRQTQQNIERLHLLLDATQKLMAAHNVDSLLAILGETAARLVTAERATIYILDVAKAELWSHSAMGDGVGEIRVPLGTGISGRVALTGETILLDDPYNDPRFNQDIDKRTGYRTRNMLTMPVKSAMGTILGVFQLLNKRQGDYTQEDAEMLTTLAASAAVALENGRVAKVSGAYA